MSKHKKHERAGSDYIQNGDFSSGELAPWHEPGAGGKVRLELEGNQYYAAFSADGKLIQNDLLLTDRPERATFSLDIRVENGSEENSHDVQAVLFFQTDSGNPVIVTLGVPEFPEWTTVEAPLFLSNRPSRADVELLVQPRFTDKVSMTNISLVNTLTRGKTHLPCFEIDVYECGRKHK